MGLYAPVRAYVSMHMQGGQHPDEVYTIHGWVRAGGMLHEPSGGMLGGEGSLALGLSAEGSQLLASLGINVRTSTEVSGVA